MLHWTSGAARRLVGFTPFLCGRHRPEVARSEREAHFFLAAAITLFATMLERSSRACEIGYQEIATT